MKTKSFKSILKSVEKLNSQQDRLLREQLTLLANKKHVSMRLETPYPDIRCPHCEGKEIHRWGKRNDMQRYRCKSCKKTFNCLTKTPLAHLRRKGHWLDYAQCLKDGLSIRRAALFCGISTNTAFRWRHRFLIQSTSIKPDKLQGIVEADEAYFRKSEKGNRKLGRPARQRGGKIHKRISGKDFVCVFVGRDRNTNTYDEIFENFTSDKLTHSFKKCLGNDILLCTDSRSVYRKFSRENRFRHGYINISKGEHVKKDIVHIQNAYNYHTELKSWITLKLKGVATKYLHNYLAWFREWDEFNFQITAHTILLRAKSGGIYKLQPLTGTQQEIPFHQT